MLFHPDCPPAGSLSPVPLLSGSGVSGQTEQGFMSIKPYQGELPKKRDISNWESEKIFQFLRLAQFFINYEEDKFQVNPDKIREVLARMSDEAYWPEFMERLDFDPELGHRCNQYRLRLVTAIRSVCSWLKDNPHAVTTEMEAIMEPTTRLNWALNPIRDKETKIGAELVTLDQDERTDERHPNAKANVSHVATPEAQFQMSIKKMTSLLKELVESVDRRQIKALPLDKKLRHIDSFIRTLEKINRGKSPNSVVFKNLTINQASRDELENAINVYAQGE